MYDIEQQIADLELEISLLETSLQATSNPDARRWIAACLTVCLREHIRLTEQCRSAAITSLGEWLRERSVGDP